MNGSALSVRKIADRLSLDPLVPVAAAALAGITLADRIHPPLPAVLGANGVLLVALALSAALRRRSVLLLAGTASTFAVLHLLGIDGQRRFPFADLLDRYPAVSVTADALVVEPPRAMPQENRFRYAVRLIEIGNRNERWRTWHRVTVLQDGPPPAYGDRLRIQGELRAIRKARNPGEFSPDLFLKRAGLVAELHAGDGGGIDIVSHGNGNPLYAFALRCRAWIQTTITRDLADSPGIAAVLKAMALGDREGTPDDIEASFRHSGALHIFAVSGLHVGIFGYILWTILRLFGMRRAHTVYAIIPCLFFYAYVTGWSPSAVRAAVMSGIYLGGFALLRPARLLNSLAAAALLILAFDTQQLYLPGFQLSFAVLAFIALFAGPISRRLRPLVNPDPFLPKALVPPWRRTLAGAGNYFVDLAAVSAAAWIGSAPLGLWHFKLITPIAILANCALVPLAWVILVVSSLSLLAAGVGLTWVSVLFNNANWAAAHLLLATSSAFAAVPGSHFYIEAFPQWRRESCRVTVLDTGLGGGAQLITAARPRRHVLVDAGGPRSYFDTVRPFLRGEIHAGQRLDALAITHGDAQHLAGAVPLLAHLPPAELIESPLQNRSPHYRELLAALQSDAPAPPAVRVLSAGDLVFSEPGRRHSLRVLYPPAGARHDFAADDQCLVLQLQSHSWKILFMADSGFATEKWLLAHVPPGDLRSHVIIKGRHRSDFSGLPEFLNAVQPDVIVTTNATFPENERLAPEWNEMLAVRGIALFDQSETGAVTIRCTRRTLRVRAYLTGQTFDDAIE